MPFDDASLLTGAENTPEHCPQHVGVLVALAVQSGISEASRAKMADKTRLLSFKKAMFSLYLEIASDKDLRMEDAILIDEVSDFNMNDGEEKLVANPEMLAASGRDRQIQEGMVLTVSRPCNACLKVDQIQC